MSSNTVPCTTSSHSILHQTPIVHPPQCTTAPRIRMNRGGDETRRETLKPPEQNHRPTFRHRLVKINIIGKPSKPVECRVQSSLPCSSSSFPQSSTGTPSPASAASDIIAHTHTHTRPSSTAMASTGALGYAQFQKPLPEKKQAPKPGGRQETRLKRQSSSKTSAWKTSPSVDAPCQSRPTDSLTHTHTHTEPAEADGHDDK